MKISRKALKKYLDRYEDSKRLTAFCLDSFDDGMLKSAETPAEFVAICREIFYDIERGE